MPTEELAHYLERSRKGVERNRLALHCIERKLTMRDGEVPADGDILALPRFAYLRNKTPGRAHGAAEFRATGTHAL